ncbi:MAG: tryptophan halogenase family protein [Asticcacaulis sp.]|uniref:tryptophan halogenase family protein n=1 Tax=Asticcacaulis sp. TaxID=1872648 RepID=UPI003F7B5AF8
MTRPIEKIVIVGGGTAGWMTAAPLIQRLGRACVIELVESTDIGTVGVGEATLPTVRYYNRSLGIDEADFIRKTKASFKLGIEFRDWGHVGNRFFHGFGDFGPSIEGRSPYMHWLRLKAADPNFPDYEEWSVATVLARQNKFTHPSGDRPSASNAYTYGYHLDASLYAAYLRDFACKRGVNHTEGKIIDIDLDAESGFIRAVRLTDGRQIAGDLFIDCSGFKGLLIEGAMKAGYTDWSEQLLCDSAITIPCARKDPLTPFTTSTAKPAGWTWRIPLQHRTGNGHVYSSHFMNHTDAEELLLEGLDGEALASSRRLRFTPGRRNKAWINNCVAIGLSSGFIEPLESTAIRLIESAVAGLLENFPDTSFRPQLAAEFNRQTALQYESIRDFVIMHYKLTGRRDSAFWRHCAEGPVSGALQHQLDTFKATGRVVVYDPNSFTEPSWVALYLGLGLTPESYDPFIDLLDEHELREHFLRIRQLIRQMTASTPLHGDYIMRHCLSDTVG